MVDPGGLFIVHMFTHTGDRSAIEAEVMRGTENTVGLIGEIEQDSALLASEDNDFLIRMGVSRKLLTEVMYQTSAVYSGNGATRRCLTQEEVRRYNVVNQWAQRARSRRPTDQRDLKKSSLAASAGKRDSRPATATGGAE